MCKSLQDDSLGLEAVANACVMKVFLGYGSTFVVGDDPSCS